MKLLASGLLLSKTNLLNLGGIALELFLALQFLTRIPIKIKGHVEELNLARAMSFFPLVGIIIGIMSAGVYMVSQLLFPGSVSDFFVLAFIVLITGNMHLDGLMDTADGIFSGKPRDKMLEIMKDSRVGSHGLAAGVLALLGRFILMGNLSQDVKIFALIAAPLAGRWAQVFGAWKYPYARESGGTGGFTKMVGVREFAAASTLSVMSLFVLLILCFLGRIPSLSMIISQTIIKGIALITVILIFALSLTGYIAGRLGGLTGDTYGAVSEIVELVILMLFPIIVNI